MVAWENVAVAVFTVSALALLLVALRAWSQARSRKILLLALAFALFLAKGVLLTWALFSVPDWKARLALPGLLLDTAALLLVYAAVLAPRR
jgi:hypothetical protein